MALNPKQLHLRANKELKVTHVKGFKIVVRAGRCLRNVCLMKSDAFYGMPGLELFYTIKQLYLFSTLCGYVNINIQISGSFHLETTAHKLTYVDDWQNSVVFQCPPR